MGTCSTSGNASVACSAPNYYSRLNVNWATRDATELNFIQNQTFSSRTALKDVIDTLSTILCQPCGTKRRVDGSGSYLVSKMPYQMSVIAMKRNGMINYIAVDSMNYYVSNPVTLSIRTTLVYQLGYWLIMSITHTTTFNRFFSILTLWKTEELTSISVI